MIRWSKLLEAYIMNFYRPKYVTCKKTESWRHTRCPRDRGARPVRVGAPSTLVEASCPSWTTSFFLKFLNIPKLVKIAFRIVLESCLLTVPHTYSFLEFETFWKVSLMYSSRVTVSIILVSTLIGLPEI